MNSRTPTSAARFPLPPELLPELNDFGFVLDLKRVERVKKVFAGYLPGLKPSHRVEVAARGFGFRTFASLRSRLTDAPILISELFAERATSFCAGLGIEASEDSIAFALKSVAAEFGSGAIYYQGERE